MLKRILIKDSSEIPSQPFPNWLVVFVLYLSSITKEKSS